MLFSLPGDLISKAGKREDSCERIYKRTSQFKRLVGRQRDLAIRRTLESAEYPVYN